MKCGIGLIANDVIANHEAGRSSLVLSERTSHVETLADMISEKVADVIPLTGKYGPRRTREALQKISDAPLRNDGVNLLIKSGVHQKFAVIDERIVWYGSINLLSFGTAEETMMRLESSNIASELLKSVGL